MPMTRWDLYFTPGPEGLRNETDVSIGQQKKT
jgi:hypothetical protein